MVCKGGYLSLVPNCALCLVPGLFATQDILHILSVTAVCSGFSEIDIFISVNISNSHHSGWIFVEDPDETCSKILCNGRGITTNLLLHYLLIDYDINYLYAKA